MQKSQYGLSYYLNVQFDFTAAVSPHMADARDNLGGPFSIEGRAERSFNEDDTWRLRELLDIEDHPLVEEHREHELLAFLETKLQPVLGDLDSLAGIEAYYRAGVFRAFLVSGSARCALAASAPD